MRRERGGVAILMGLLLPAFIALLALVIDVGHFLQVREELQNGADAAALAGIRDLDGTLASQLPARQSAQFYASQHKANGTPISISLNLGNDPLGDIVLGNWDPATRAFTEADATMPLPLVNAVKAVTRRTSQSGGAVTTFFAPVLGVMSKNLGTHGVAVGGGPANTCGFPLAVADCSLLGPTGGLRCNSSMTFGDATTDNVGFTLFAPTAPVDTPGIDCEVANALGRPCTAHGNCTCNGCNATAISNGTIYVSNGNNLSKQTVTNIQQAVAAAGAAGLLVDVPVLDSGGLTAATCGNFQYNRQTPIVGYVKMKLTGATGAPNKSITASVDCTQTSTSTAGGGFFGYKSINPYLAQ